VVICLERGADYLHMVQLMPLLSKNPIISFLIKIQTGFYRAMLSISGISHGPVSFSLCLSVTSRCSIKTDEGIGLVFGVWERIRPILCCVIRKFM